jgi:hypothetical protein
MDIYDTVEGARLRASDAEEAHPWRQWGPYLSERAWGTVREDYSADGDAWNHFPHAQARSRAYRWSEDGIAGISDDEQRLCFALALWNGRDEILKERMFGLSGPEGNHGEDVKEYWFYLDNTPTHSYMKYLYKYPQAAYPYARLVEENGRRSKEEPEFELVDTGIFDAGRYFDVVVDYAKATPDDLLVRIEVVNRGDAAAPIHVLPTLWFRNTWSWGRDERRPSIARGADLAGADGPVATLVARRWDLGTYTLACAGADALVFTENETNSRRLYGEPDGPTYAKDAFHDLVVGGDPAAVNPTGVGTKAAAWYRRSLAPGEAVTLRLRLSAGSADGIPHDPFADFDEIFERRRAEADEFYGAVLPAVLSDDARLVARQALAGMLWSKQYYHLIQREWLEGDPAGPAPASERKSGRNHEWQHLYQSDIISMPDKWEFPWYASWDLGFHCVALAHVDPQLAKDQIILMLREWYMHPNGQIPAYEWNFSDVNPPVLSLAARVVFEHDRRLTGVADLDFLKRVFHKAMLNFTWWVNRKDAQGNNVFQGGFLGMDNIGAFDRGDLPPGYLLGQADGTSWMAAFAKNLLAIALVLAETDPAYEDLATKFWEHYLVIAASMNNLFDPERSLWDEADGFFYDALIDPGGRRRPIRARTMVGFVPLFGASAMPADAFDAFPEFRRRVDWVMTHFEHLVPSAALMFTPGPTGQVVLGLVRPDQLARMLGYMLDEEEFLSPYGIRSLSRRLAEAPLEIDVGGQVHRLDYAPGESTSGLFGGNSNWRGPVWLPVNRLLLFELEQYHLYFGEGFTVDCPTGSGQRRTLHQVAQELAGRLGAIFLRGEGGRRPVLGDVPLFQDDPHWRDLVPFHEYFHGDTGRGCGASHQTGWTGLVADVLIRYADQFAADPATGASVGQPTGGAGTN